MHFHEFLSMALADLDVNTIVDKSDIVRWTKDVCEFLIGYPDFDPRVMFDAILIDEGQDFEEFWLKAALRFLNSENDELLVVYDRVQDIYNREAHVWLDSGTSGLGFRGRPGNLPETYRLPLEMAELLNNFCKIYGLDNRIYVNKELYSQLSFEYDLGHKYVNLEWINEDAARMTDIVRQTVQTLIENSEHPVNRNDITVITFSEKTGVEIVDMLTSCGIKSTHVYDLNLNSDNDANFGREGGRKKLFGERAEPLKFLPFIAIKDGNAITL